MIRKEACMECRGKMIEKTGSIAGVSQRYWECAKCGDKVVDMEQLHEAAEKWRELRKKAAKISKWGTAIAVRIPKEIVKEKKIKIGQEAFFAPEKEGFRVILQKAPKKK